MNRALIEQQEWFWTMFWVRYCILLFSRYEQKYLNVILKYEATHICPRIHAQFLIIDITHIY